MFLIIAREEELKVGKGLKRGVEDKGARRGEGGDGEYWRYG